MTQDMDFGSLDVVALYPSIPLTGTESIYNITSQFFQEHRGDTVIDLMTTEDFTTLLKLAISTNRIDIEGICYTQTQGLAMGNNLSGLLSSIYMDYIEMQAITKLINAGTDIIIWLRYVIL